MITTSRRSGNPMLKKKLAKIKGSCPPIVTPFSGGVVDYEIFEKLLKYHLDKGSHGVLINGTTGEPSTLTVEERNRLVDIAIETISGRIPVVVATGSQSFSETEKLTKHAVKAGADALLIVTPYYIKPPQRGLVEYFTKLSLFHDLPWMIYHIPGRAAVNVDLETLSEIKRRCDNFVGMKHASSDLGFVSSCLKTLGSDFKIFVGLEELSFPMMSIGACGLMNAVGNLCPDILVSLVEAVWNNDLELARKEHDKLFLLNRSVFFDTNPIPIKYMMKRIGLIPSNEHRLPMVSADKELEGRLDQVLKSSGLI